MAFGFGWCFVCEASQLDEQVSTGLTGLVRLARGKDILVPDAGFERLSAVQKVVVYALARFAVARSGEVTDVPLAATSKDYSRALALDLKACQDILSRLQRRHILAREGRGCAILTAAIQKALAMLKNDRAK